MKSKFMLLTATLTLGVTLLTGCKNTTTKAPTSTTTASSDTVAKPSQISDEATFLKRLTTKDGYFMIIVNKELTFTIDLTLEGGVKKEDKETRSIAFVKTVTVPNFIVESPNTLFENGTIKGNVYVVAAGFSTKEAKIDGNLYFATEELKNAFIKDDKTTITGEVLVGTYTK